MVVNLSFIVARGEDMVFTKVTDEGVATLTATLETPAATGSKPKPSDRSIMLDETIKTRIIQLLFPTESSAYILTPPLFSRGILNLEKRRPDT